MSQHAIIAQGTQLTVSDIGPQVVRVEDIESLKPPPGLDFDIENVKDWRARFSPNRHAHANLEPGLPAKVTGAVRSSDVQLVCKKGLPAKVFAEFSDGCETDDTSVGSLTDTESSQASSRRGSLADPADSSPPSPKLISQCSPSFSEMPKMRASAISFIPAHDEGAVHMPVSQVQAPARTKLNSKADSFKPSLANKPLPFMPMAAVVKAWEKYEQKYSWMESQPGMEC